MESVVAVIGTLLGATVGVVGSYLIQRAQLKRETHERLSDLRRETYLAWVTRVHAYFASAREASRPKLSENQRVTKRVRPERTDPVPAQTALEGLRLVASDEAAASAAKVWSHLRRHKVPDHGAASMAEWNEWQDDYWTLRRNFLDAARRDLGFEPLNWLDAGATYRTQRARSS